MSYQIVIDEKSSKIVLIYNEQLEGHTKSGFTGSSRLNGEL